VYNRLMNSTDIAQLEQQLPALDQVRGEAWKELNEHRKELQAQSIDAYTAAGGCPKCGGRGWVVTWDTLDSMSGCYAEYGPCPSEESGECTPVTRERTGLDPSYYNKYDRNRGIPKHAAFRTPKLTAYEDAHTTAKKTYDSAAQQLAVAKQITKGKLVEVFRKARSKGAPPKGTQGIVFWTGSNSWGTHKAGLRLKDGSKVWVPSSACRVLETTPSDGWTTPVVTDGVPFIGITKAAGPNAALLRTLEGTKEFWAPYSQCPTLKGVKKGQSVSVTLPLWLAKKNGVW